MSSSVSVFSKPSGMAEILLVVMFSISLPAIVAFCAVGLQHHQRAIRLRHDQAGNAAAIGGEDRLAGSTDRK